LITAATRGDLQMVTLLVESQADLTLGDRNGKTAFVLADQRGFSSVAEYLQSVMEPENDDENGEGGEKGDGEEKEKKDGEGEKPKDAPISLYKGLQEKAEKQEKQRLNNAAALANERRERWAKLVDDVAKMSLMEAEAKLELEEALKAQSALSGKTKKKGAGGQHGSPNTVRQSSADNQTRRPSETSRERESTITGEAPTGAPEPERERKMQRAGSVQDRSGGSIQQSLGSKSSRT